MLYFNNNQPYIEGVSLNQIIKIHKTPCYIYSQKIICENYQNLKQALNSEIFYSVKANSNQSIIKLINSLGAGADVVSLGELKRALSANVNPEKIIFEGVGKSTEDILYAIQKKIRLINIESFEELNKINSIASNHNKKVNVGIRINPNIDGQMIDKISTGKKTDKFGISIDNISEIIEKIKIANNLNLIGISCHIGSQIHDLKIFEAIFNKMKNVAKEFLNNNVSIKHLDLGGGIGVNYSDKEPRINLNDLNKLINNSFKDVSYKISFEPGRYLVAKAGVLLTQIITTKSNGGINYLITDAGMNNLIRPALYGSVHNIEVINDMDLQKINYTIAGPICESSDIFAKNVNLPLQKSGNHLIINDVGAYGAVMSSNYNSRELPTEILINNTSIAVIKKPQSIEETIDQEVIPNWL